MIDRSVPYGKVIMINRTAKSYPKIPLPDGFKICGYTDSYKETWLELAEKQHGAERDTAIETFEREFLSRAELLSERCLFVVDEKDGRAVATASILRDELAPGVSMNRIQWVATMAEYQGKGLIKALLSHVMDLYQKLGEEGGIYIITQTQSYAAINIYKKFGFIPYMGELHRENFDLTAHREAWQIINRKINEYKR